MTNNLQDAPSAIVRKLLVDLGLASDPLAVPLLPWPAYAKSEPPTPDNCVTVYDTAGTSTGRAHPTGELFGYQGFQVRVRAATDRAGWIEVDAIMTTLAQDVYRRQVTVGANTYLVQCVTRIGDAIALGREAGVSERRLWTLNAQLDARQLMV